MKQFILKMKPDVEGIVRLLGEDYHYLVRVRRLRAGNVFPALCGSTPEEIEVLSTDGGVLTGKVKSAVRSGAVSLPELPPVFLFQALPKGRKIDLIVRQAAECAVSEVCVFVSERSVPESAAGRERRWECIVKEARQQSGSRVETRTRFLPSLDAALVRWTEAAAETPAAALLLCEPSAPVPAAQETFHHCLGDHPALTAVAVGPEGGFSGAEIARFLDAGFKAVCMGDTVLRVETAALCGIAAARIILLEKQ